MTYLDDIRKFIIQEYKIIIFIMFESRRGAAKFTLA